MPLLERFGPTIGRLRVARKLSQEKLAHLSGIHATFVGAIERGEKSVSLETLEGLARGLGIPPWELVRMAAAEDVPTTSMAIEPGTGSDYAGSSNRLRFSIVAERTSAGYSAYCPDLPGCAATGESRVEVERAMQHAIAAEVQHRLRTGAPIPQPSSYATIITVTI